MSRKVLVLWVSFFLLCFGIVVIYGALEVAPRVESKIAQNTKLRLQTAGFSSDIFSIDGRMGLLSGEVDSRARRDIAQFVAEGAPGHYFARVENQLGIKAYESPKLWLQKDDLGLSYGGKIGNSGDDLFLKLTQDLQQKGFRVQNQLEAQNDTRLLRKDERNVAQNLARMIQNNPANLRAEYDGQGWLLSGDLPSEDDKRQWLSDVQNLVAPGTIVSDRLTLLSVEKSVELSIKDYLHDKIIEFDTGKASLRPQAKAIVRQVATLLLKAPSSNIQIAGHTDNQGPRLFNQKLSKARAETVLRLLKDISKIDARRLTAVGYGVTKPIANNEHKLGRQRNRRIEFTVSGGE